MKFCEKVGYPHMKKYYISQYGKKLNSAMHEPSEVVTNFFKFTIL